MVQPWLIVQGTVLASVAGPIRFHATQLFDYEEDSEYGDSTDEMKVTAAQQSMATYTAPFTLADMDQGLPFALGLGIDSLLAGAGCFVSIGIV